MCGHVRGRCATRNGVDGIHTGHVTRAATQYNSWYAIRSNAYNEKKVFIYGDFFLENFSFAMVSFIIVFKFLFDVFSPGFKFGMDSQKHINFSILSKVFQNYAPSGAF